MIAWSRGSSKLDADPEQRLSPDFDAFVRALEVDRAPAKEQAYFAAPFASNGNGNGRGHRGKETVQPVEFLILDFDHLTPESEPDLLDWLKSFRGAAWRTHSSTDQAPRRCALLQLSRPTTRPECIGVNQVMARDVHDALGVDLDTAQFKPEQPRYMPPVGVAFAHFWGEPIDVDLYLTLVPPLAAAPSPASNGTGAILEGGRNQALTALAGKLRRIGLGASELQAALRECNRQRCRPPLSEADVATIARSVARYEPTPDESSSNESRLELTEVALGKFLAAEQHIEFLIDDVLRRGWFYSLTGPTGHGKTGIAVPLALDVADTGVFGGNECNGGPVLYIASENPDDVRARFCVALECAKRWSRNVTQDVYVIDQSFVLAQRLPSLAAIVERLGVVLIIVDTDQAIAMTSADDENSNASRLEHAKRLRTLTKCASRPTVIDLCHPIKHVASVDGCVPRGGGSFLNEVDGNFRLWKNGDLVELSSDPNKFRGAPVTITFRVEMVTTEKLKDTKDRLLTFPLFVAVSESDASALGREQWSDGNRLLDAILAAPDGSLADWARACQWLDNAGKPLKSKVHRLLTQLLNDDPPLVRRRRGGRWALTQAGEKEAKKSS